MNSEIVMSGAILENFVVSAFDRENLVVPIGGDIDS